MSNKGRNKKGFTLVELVIVMALFSIIMLAVMRIADPASKIMKNTTISENTYATTDNIESYLKGQLQYSEALWIVTEDKLGGSYNLQRISGDKVEFNDDIENVARAFVKEYYSNVVVHIGTGPYLPSSKVDGFSDTKYVNGNVYVMHLMNGDGGNISLTRYGFQAKEDDCVLSAPETVEDALSTIFGATESYYNYNFAVGAHDSRELAGAEIGTVNENNLAVSILVNQKDGNYSSLSVANIPLINSIKYNNDRDGRKIVSSRTVYKPATATDEAKIVRPTKVLDTFKAFVNSNVDLSDDIYFIYSYANELE